MGVVTWRYRIRIADSSVSTMDTEFAPAATSDDLTGAVDRRSLGGRMITPTLSARLDDVPAPAGIRNDMSRVLAHFADDDLPIPVAFRTTD